MADLRSLLNRHLPLALQLAEHRGRPVEASIRRRLEALATCGDPAYGFMWLRCDPCAQDRMVAFSCKSRVICPRCGGRRMASTAAHLVDEVLPEQRLRQWVFTFPQPLPRLLAWEPDLLRRTLAVVTHAVGASLRRRTRAEDGRAGLVSFIQTVARHRRWIAAHSGVEVHAGVVIEAGDVAGREHLIRYAARPGLCLDRLSLDEEGRVQIRFKRPWKNGTTGVTLEPAVFLLRLASLLLPCGVNLVLVGYHGVFAPAARGREHVVRAAGPPGGEVRRSRWRRWAVLIERAFGRCPEARSSCGRTMVLLGAFHGDGRVIDVDPRWAIGLWRERQVWLQQRCGHGVVCVRRGRRTLRG